MADKPKQKLVVIENSTLDAMARDPRILRELPFLRSLGQQRRADCGSCGGNANNRAVAATYQAAKQAIANLPSVKKQAIKQILNTNGLRVVFRSGSTVVQLTF